MQTDLFAPPVIAAATGHRPSKLPTDAESQVKVAYRKALTQLKPDWFISGMAIGVDTWAAEVALELGIKLWAAVPFEGQERRWVPADQERFKSILARASKTTIVCQGTYDPKMFQKRNIFMVDNCTILLAYWDGTPGGTGNCVKYARKVNRNMTNLFEKAKVAKIANFHGNYSFLSNFYDAPVKFDEVRYKTSEHAYQTQKTPIESERLKIMQAATPADTKKLGRAVHMRKDWENVKFGIMYQIVLAKFQQNEDIRKQLLATGNTELIEGNFWHDTFFGVCTCSQHRGEGRNALGNILMQVREELAENSTGNP